MYSLPDREKQSLLKIARREVQRAAHGSSLDFTLDNASHIPCEGVFVTLRRKGRLRGCIGQLSSPDSLAAVVAHCARAAALEDPRFKPLQAEELSEMEIEISVLSTAEETTMERIETGKHGLIVSNGARRGVLLPQVALQFRWGAERFVEETCVKAGIHRQAWKDSATRIQAFTAESFSGPADSLPEESASPASESRGVL